MNRLPLLTGLLLLPAIAVAQPRSPADRVTGLAPDQPSLGTEQVLDYLKAVRYATTEVEFEPRGASRREFHASKLKLTATWRKGRDGRPVMTSATVVPVGSKYFQLGDHKIYKLTINNKGEIHLDRKGINATIYKITRDKHGNMILDLPWYLLGDVTIPKDEVFLDISKWPPDLQELVQALTKESPSNPQATKHEGVLRWRITGAADAHDFPFKGGKVRAATNFDITGAGILRPDKSFQTVGSNNRAKLTLTVGNSHYRHATGNMEADVRGGRGTFNGNYAISVPSGDKRFTMSLDGRVRYDVSGRNIKMSVPSGTKLHAGTGGVSGTGRLVGSIGPNGSAVKLEDGTYTLDLSGPLGVTGLEAGDLTLDDLNATGTIHSEGTIDELSSNRLAGDGRWRGDLTTSGGRGARGALSGDAGTGAFTIKNGSKVTFDLTDGRFEAGLGGRDLRRRKPTTFSGRFRGNVAGELNLGDLDYSGKLGDVDAPEVTTRFNLNVDAGDLGDPSHDMLRDTHGSLHLDLPRGGTLTKRDLPGAPIETRKVPEELPETEISLPEPPASLPPATRKHHVVRGDTLSGLSRTYGVPADAIRRANGIPLSGPKKDLIRLGDTLEIPPAEGQSPTRSLRPRARPTDVARRRPRMVTEVLSRGPDGKAVVNLAPGTSVDVDVDDARMTPRGLEVDGSVAATVKISSAELTGSMVEAKILGAAQASLAKTHFRIRPGADGKYSIQVDRVPVKVDIDLRRGSVLHMNSQPSKPVEIKVDGDAGYVRFDVVVETGPDGALRIKDRQLTKVDMLIETNDLVAFADRSVRMGGKKSFKYNGRVRFPADGGIQFIDQVWLGVSGDEDHPALEIGR